MELNIQIDGCRYITTEGAAAMLGCSSAKIRRMANNGTLTARATLGRVWFAFDAVERLAKERNHG